TAIREQLNRILVSRLFAHSKRYPTFLQYVVEQTLAGHGAELKERTIGIEVFERDPDYDSSADPVVRVTAGEIRKRLAQYYSEAGHGEQLRIELTPGSYVPVFQVPIENPSTIQNVSPESLLPVPLFATQEVLPQTEVQTETPRPAAYRIGLKWLWVAPALGVLLLAWLSYRAVQTPHFPAFEGFWSQVINANGPVQICYGAYVEQNPANPGLPLAMDALGSTDLIVSVLEQRGKTYSNTIRMIGPEVADFTKFRHGPVIYFGPLSPVKELNDSWRFRFLDDTTPRWIADTSSSKKLWRVEEGVPPADISEGYSIATRLMDRTLNRPVIVVVGFSRAGVSGGVEFLTTPEYLEPVLKSAPKEWQEMNLQLIIETRVHGKRGTPKVVASHFWK
ncbi:MAG: hypothetical protein AB7O65_03625, partial [Candidatus Korobacteraceae bacterium]